MSGLSSFSPLSPQSDRRRSSSPPRSTGRLSSSNANSPSTRRLSDPVTADYNRNELYSDRFIPSRIASNLEDAFEGHMGDGVAAKSVQGSDQVQNNQNMMNSMLRSELLGHPYTAPKIADSTLKPSTTGVSPMNSPSRSVLKFRSSTSSGSRIDSIASSPIGSAAVGSPARVTHRLSSGLSPYSSSPGAIGGADTRRAARKISRIPYKVLDAPSPQDDYYLNLLDWSSTNVVAVALGSAVYLWSACTSKVTKLCELGTADTVTAIAWALNGSQLAIGANSGQIHIWDAARGHKIRELASHASRVGTLAWNSSMLASGSRDRSIYVQDIRWRGVGGSSGSSGGGGRGANSSGRGANTSASSSGSGSRPRSGSATGSQQASAIARAATGLTAPEASSGSSRGGREMTGSSIGVRRPRSRSRDGDGSWLAEGGHDDGDDDEDVDAADISMMMDDDAEGDDDHHRVSQFGAGVSAGQVFDLGLGASSAFGTGIGTFTEPVIRGAVGAGQSTSLFDGASDAMDEVEYHRDDVEAEGEDEEVEEGAWEEDAVPVRSRGEGWSGSPTGSLALSGHSGGGVIDTGLAAASLARTSSTGSGSSTGFDASAFGRSLFGDDEDPGGDALPGRRTVDAPVGVSVGASGSVPSPWMPPRTPAIDPNVLRSTRDRGARSAPIFATVTPGARSSSSSGAGGASRAGAAPSVIGGSRPIVAELNAHKQEVCGLKWSFDERMLASGGNDNKLYVWAPLYGGTGNGGGGGSSGGGSTSGSSSGGGSGSRGVNVGNGRDSGSIDTNPICRFSDHCAAVKAVGWSPHQHGLLASGGGTADRHIRFWNSLTATPLHRVDTGSQVCNLMFSKNANEIVSTHGYSLNQVIVWKYPSMQKLATLTGHTMRVLYLAMSPDGQGIVTGAGDETLRFWNVFPGPRNGTGARIGPTALLPTGADIR